MQCNLHVYGERLLSRCSSENQREIGWSKADNDNAHSNAMVAISGYICIDTLEVHKSWADGQLETTPSNSTRHVARIWSFTLCKVGIRIPANQATSARNSSRCAPEIHGRIPWCGETQRQVLGRIVHIPNNRASAYEMYKDSWRTDKRKGDDREPAFGVGLVHACLCKQQWDHAKV